MTADPFAPQALAHYDDELHAANVRPVGDPLALPILALDLGTSMGWALRTSACVSSGTANWTDRRKDETRGGRLLRYWRWLHMVHRGTPLSLVAYENASFLGPANVHTAAAYAQFEGVTLMFAARNDIPVRDVHNSTLKKAITGSGKHPKGKSKEALAKAIHTLGYKFDTQDECDALAVMHWAAHVR